MRSGPDLLPLQILGQHLVPGADLRAPGAGAEADPVRGGGGGGPETGLGSAAEAGPGQELEPDQGTL